jgi:hypothetical protein
LPPDLRHWSCARPRRLAPLPQAQTPASPTPTTRRRAVLPGFKGTSETSYQVAGPGTINYTETSTANQTFSVGTSVGVEAGVIIAKAETTFSVDYSYSTSSSKAWSYSTTIPAGKTGIMAVMHRNDRVSTVKYTDQPNCTTTSTTFYSYIPRAGTSNLDYCIIRDLYPYGYNTWRATCTGE